MKRFFYFAFIALAVLSCKKDEPNNNGKNNNQEQPEVETFDSISAVLEGATLKAAWEEGDAIQVICVTEEGVDKSSKYVLSAGAGTSDGTFVPAEGSKGAEKGGKAYFASYPYNEDLMFAQHNTFAITLPSEQTTPAPMFSYVEDAANAFSFSGFLGAIRFTLTGKGSVAAVEIDDVNTNSILYGNTTINPKTGRVNVKNGASTKYAVTYRLAEKMVLEESTSDPIVVELPANTLAEGAKLTVLDVNNSPLAVIDVPAQTITAGVVTDAGNFEFKAQAQTVDLGLAGLANCYIIPDVGKYKFQAVKGNDSSAKLAASSAVLLWETWCNAEEVTPNSLVKDISFENGYVVFETADTFHAGDASVAVKDAEGNILWAWTLWFTDVTIPTVTVHGTVELMDRNLGALSAKPEDQGLNYGLLFQYGRHNGFVACDGTHSGTPAKTAPAYEEAFSWVKQAAAHDKTTEYAVQHPTEMIAGQTCWYDPSVEGEIWSNGVKGLYDPCPAGYKAPDYDYSGGAYASINSADTYSKDEVNGGIVMDGMYYPFAGYLKYNSSSYYADGSFGMYWTTAQRSDNTDNAQSFQASSTKQSYDRKSSAFSIRCQKLSAQ